MKYFSRQLSLGFVLGFLAFALPAQAQEFRLGYVNLDRIIREAVPAKNAQAKLEQEFSRREKELQDQGAGIKSAAEKLDREAPTLSEGQRTSR